MPVTMTTTPNTHSDADDNMDRLPGGAESTDRCCRMESQMLNGVVTCGADYPTTHTRTPLKHRVELALQMNGHLFSRLTYTVHIPSFTRYTSTRLVQDTTCRLGLNPSTPKPWVGLLCHPS